MNKQAKNPKQGSDTKNDGGHMCVMWKQKKNNIYIKVGFTQRKEKTNIERKNSKK